MVSYRWYILVYTSHMTSGTKESYESYMTVYVCHMTCCLRAGAPARSRIALEMQSLDCNGVYCASASLNALVPLGSRHGVAGPARTPVDAGGNSRHRRRRQWRGCAAAADAHGSGGGGGGGKPPLQMPTQVATKSHWQQTLESRSKRLLLAQK